MGFYLYGIVGARGSDSLDLPTGVGDPPGLVELLPFRQVAAVVTRTPVDETPGLQVRGLRRDIAAHSNVVDRVFAQTTIIPMRFGIVLPNDDERVEEHLASEYATFRRLLGYLDGRAELTLRASYEEDGILREIAREQPELARPAPRSSRPSRDHRIERGRRVVEAIQAKGARDRQRLLAALMPLACDVVLEEPVADTTFLNAAFLVPRDQIAQFDEQVQACHEEHGKRLRLDYIGPLPPYSFSGVENAADLTEVEP